MYGKRLCVIGSLSLSVSLCHLKPDVAFKVALREELSDNRVCPLHVNFPLFAGIREVGSMQQRLQR